MPFASWPFLCFPVTLLIITESRALSELALLAADCPYLGPLSSQMPGSDGSSNNYLERFGDPLPNHGKKGSGGGIELKRLCL